MKDYNASPNKHAAAGTKELWIFDPKLCGPKGHGGPVRIQVWARSEDETFRRVYAGDGPAQSPSLGGWLFAVDDGQRLRIADDREGTHWWMTALEAERAAKEAERAAREAERTAREAGRAELEAAIARIAELESRAREAVRGGCAGGGVKRSVLREAPHPRRGAADGGRSADGVEIRLGGDEPGSPLGPKILICLALAA